jgi:hypothetical protein
MENTPAKSPVRPGWIERELAHKPRALFFGILAILWIFPSIGAIWILLADFAWLEAPTWLARLRAIPLEQWVAILLLAAHGLWVYLAFRWRRREEPKVPGSAANNTPASDSGRAVTDPE